MTDEKRADSRDEGQKTTESLPPPERLPACIGPYRILNKIGEGGMGVVYEAEQREPVRRTVALKVIKFGMDTKQVVARFETERQALALMNHTNVATVYDAGSTPEGRPYFAMEYVQGIPITGFCDRNRLSITARVELFLQACEGVQHAHQKAIIHRDIKPSNVLVATQDEEHVIKIIDFGLAKAMGQRLTEKTLVTRQGHPIGTPGYMSPEQADITVESVDTRSDVYSLGVLLYELLVGVLPIDPRRGRGRGGLEERRVIHDLEPPKPSTRFSSRDDTSTESAGRRCSDPQSMVRTLRGDLDWITMKALERDRARRYGSPQELASDLRRYLRHDPVHAGPPGAVYRLRKFVRRHRLGVAAGSLIAMALVVGLTMASIGLVRARRAERDARREAETAERVSVFLADMLGEVNAARMGGRLVEDLRDRVAQSRRAEGASEGDVAAAVVGLDASMRGVNSTDVALRMIDQEILLRAASTLEKEFEGDPVIKARLQQTISVTYERLGLHQQAEQHAQHALDIRTRVLGEDHPQTLQSANHLARVYWQQGRLDEAEALNLKTLNTVRRALGEDHIETLISMTSLATVYFDQGRYEEAEALYAAALEGKRRVLGDEHEETIRSMTNLANAYWSQGRHEDALALDRKALDVSRRVLGDDHLNSLVLMTNIADMYTALDRFDEAESLHESALDAKRRVLGDNHIYTQYSIIELAAVYAARGRYDESEALVREVVEEMHLIPGDEHLVTLLSMTTLAAVLEDLGRIDEAESVLSLAVERQTRMLGKDHPGALQSINALGEIYRRQGRYDDAATLLERALAGRRRTLPVGHPDIASSLHALACLAEAGGERRKAIDLIRQAVEGGWSSRTLLEDADLASLRGDPEFEAIALAGSKQIRTGNEPK